VDDNHIVILDVSNCPSLSKKYWDITKIPEILQQIEKSKNAKKKPAPMWSKKTLDGEDKAVPGPGEKQGDLGGWLTEDSGAGSTPNNGSAAEGGTDMYIISLSLSLCLSLSLSLSLSTHFLET
jgi:hypothetical protein